jgi:RsiW-degrading membrane proteinase PrsW (M82 family)
MSEPGMFHGWRSRVFYLTRNRRFLLRTTGTIVAAGFLIASLIVTARSGSKMPAVKVSSVEQGLQEGYGRLLAAAEPDPRQLAAWLRRQMMVLTRSVEDSAPQEAFDAFSRDGTLLGRDLGRVIGQHADGGVKDMLLDFIRGSLIGELPEGRLARSRIESLARREPPAMLACELMAGFAMQVEDSPVAARWMLREGMSFPGAAEARRLAVSLAISAEDIEGLRQIRAVPGWIEACEPLDQHLAGGLIQDIPLQWRGLLGDHFTNVPWLLVGFTLLAGLVWFVILVQHDQKDDWRWLRSLLPLLAGVLSVWPTLTILFWQEHVQGLKPAGPFPHDLWYYIIGVGMREEVCKLALFAPFLPWLLRCRAPGRALITGALVGLGFAIEENVQYYAEHGLSAAISRLLTANFMHIAMTAITGHSLYRMVRSRFAEAGQFAATFAAIVLVHAFYDWLPGFEPLREEGGWVSFVILVMLASRFIDQLSFETEPRRSTFALRAVFTLGCALLIAGVLVCSALNARSMAGVADAAKDCLAYVPIAFLYWRRFEDA